MKSDSSKNQPQAPRILLVDDNRLGLAARRALLEEQGYQVTTASDGVEAFAAFGENVFDLVVTDFKMPRADGMELIQRIREVQPEMPVVLISGYADALGLTEENTGADAVIAKSASEVNHLTRAVRRLLLRPARKPPRSVRRTTAAAKKA